MTRRTLLGIVLVLTCSSIAHGQDNILPVDHRISQWSELITTFNFNPSPTPEVPVKDAVLVIPGETYKQFEARQKLERKQEPHRIWKAIGTVASGVTYTYVMSNVCTSLVQKPLLFWTANDVEWWKACNQNGSFVLGVWVQNSNR